MALTPEEQQKLNELLEKTNQGLAKQVEFHAKMARLQGEEVSKAKELSETYALRGSLQAELLELLQTEGEERSKIAASMLQELERDKEKGRINRENYQAQVAILKEIQTLEALSRTGNEELQASAEARLHTLKQQLAEQKKLNEAQQAGVVAGASIVSNMGKLIGFSDNLSTGITGNLLKAASSGKGLGAALQGAAAQAMDLFSLSNVAAYFVQHMIEMGVAMDNVASNFVAATGASREFGAVIEDSFLATAKYGVSIQEAGSAAEALTLEFGRFSQQNNEVRQSLIESAALMEQLGISSRTTADNMTYLVSGLGIGVGEAQATLESFVTTGRQMGIPASQMAESFDALQPRLALFGKNAPQIFEQTAKAAKSLGMEVNDLGQSLFALSEGLDTFDEAAEKVAAFNLTLGGSFVNTYDLVMAAAEGPFEQIKLLRDGLEAAGRSVADLDFREKQFMAQQFGLEINTLTAILDGQIDSQDELNEQTKSLEEIAREAAPSLEILSQSLQSLTGFLTETADMFRSVATALGDGLGYVIGVVVVGSIALAIKGFLSAKAAAKDTLNTVREFTTSLNSFSQSALTAGASAEIASAGMGGIGEALGEVADEGTDVAGTTGDMADELGGLAEQADMADGKMGKLAEQLGIVAAGYSIASLALGPLTDMFDSLMGPDYGYIAAGITAIAVAAALAGAAFYGLITGPQTAIAYLAAFGIAAAGLMALASGPTGGGAPKMSKSPDLTAGAGQAKGFDMGAGMDDFIVQGEVSGKPKITPINSKDELIGAKPGGPVDEAFNRTAAPTSQVPERLIAALEKIANSMNTPVAAGAGSAQPVHVSLELDKRKFGSAVVDIVNRELNL